LLKGASARRVRQEFPGLRCCCYYYYY